jgi:hypothetical protein
MDSKLRDDKKPKGEKAEDKEGQRLKGEREDFAFHGFESVNRSPSTIHSFE